MAEVSDIEKRLRDVESLLSWAKGALAVGALVILALFGIMNFVQIPSQAKKLVDDKLKDKTINTIEAARRKADEFLKHKTHDIWPDRTYAILKNGPCPKGFEPKWGKAHTFSVHQRKVKYLEETTLGNSLFRWHEKDERPLADLELHVCLKNN